jgi:very-short-patch-repair endonuclease
MHKAHPMPPEIPRSVLRRFAREQRANAVRAEALVWRAVRDRRCEGAKFRGQAPVGNFIVDFLCFERRLAIEIDGPSHESPEQQAADRGSDAGLREQSYQILRLSNELVIASTELAVGAFARRCAPRSKAVALVRDSPHP